MVFIVHFTSVEITPPNPTNKNSFEKELKSKLSQKTGKFQTEESILMKAFKYFDLNNDSIHIINY